MFRMNLMRAKSWGYLRENGTFDGMLGDMIAGRVDLGATPLQFKEERIDVAEFTVQTWLARFRFMIYEQNLMSDKFDRHKFENLSVTLIYLSFILRPCFIFRHPKKSSVRNGFLRPFRQEVWITTFLMAILCWSLLYAIVKIELYLTKRKFETTLDFHPASESGLIVTASLCQQGKSKKKTMLSFKFFKYTNTI